jgi:UTP--glucose-1-phosphate uridylyltransferase
MRAITKAVFPVAGLGTRFLPATKANPKEMLPIVDKPLIQYAVEEAIAAGITELIFVTNSAKRAIEDHFDSNVELEDNLIARGKHELLAIVRGIVPDNVSCVYIRQKAPHGLGHAVLCAKQLIIDEPFAVLLADDLIASRPQSCLQQMLDIFRVSNSAVIAVAKIPPQDTQRYGMVAVADGDDNIAAKKIIAIVEKPNSNVAPSNLAVVGRYILPPRIFALLERTKFDMGGEIQLTDAIAQLLTEELVYACCFTGQRFDCGSKLGYLEATIAYALEHKEVGAEFKQYLRTFNHN